MIHRANDCDRCQKIADKNQVFNFEQLQWLLLVKMGTLQVKLELEEAREVEEVDSSLIRRNNNLKFRKLVGKPKLHIYQQIVDAMVTGLDYHVAQPFFKWLQLALTCI